MTDETDPFDHDYGGESHTSSGGGDDSSAEKVQVSGYVDRRTRELAQENTEFGELSQAIAELVKRKAYGAAAGDRAELKRELNEIRDKKDEHRSQIREHEAQIQSLERRETRIEERVNELTDQKERYEGHLESLEGLLADGEHISLEHGGVQRAADAHSEKCCADVIADLKDRNPTVPEAAFKPFHEADDPWTGFGGDER